MHRDSSIIDYDKQSTTQHLLGAMIELLHNSGFRVTTQRKLILEAVAYQVGWHVHPKDVYSYVHDRDKTIGMATVYRTLKMLEDMDLINKVYSMGLSSEHEMESHGNHYHTICLQCGRILDVVDGTLDNISDRLKKYTGFEATEIKMTVYGLCEDCRRIKI